MIAVGKQEQKEIVKRGSEEVASMSHLVRPLFISIVARVWGDTAIPLSAPSADDLPASPTLK